MAALTQEKADRAISAVLRYGSLISTLVMALGLGLMLIRRSATRLATYHRIEPVELFSALIRLDPAAVTEFGILLLLFTPIFRIIVAVISFALERDKKYVLISLGVLLVVLLSISFAVEG
jgi:uncharacterized membrane protein